MRKLIAIFALLAAAPAFASISIVDNDSNHGHVKCSTGSNTCYTPVIDTTGATLYVAILSGYYNQAIPYSYINQISNNGTSLDVFTCIQVSNTNHEYLEGCYAYDPVPSPKSVFRCGGTGDVSCAVTVWKGTDGTSAVLTASASAGSSSNVASIQPGSVTVCTGCLTITGWGTSASNTTLGSTPTGYTVTDVNPYSSGGNPSAQAYLLNGSSPQNPTWTPGASQNQAAVIMVFKPVTGTPIQIWNFQSGYNLGTGVLASSTITNPASLVAGNWEICGAYSLSSFNNSPPVSVSNGTDSLTKIGTDPANYDGSSYRRQSLWLGKISTTQTAAWTVTLADATFYTNLICIQYANLASSPLDATANGLATTSVSSVTSGTFSTTAANEVVFAFSGTPSAGTETFTPGSGYTLRGLDYNQVVPSTDIEQQSATEDQLTSTTLSGATASMSSNVSSARMISVATLKGVSNAVPANAFWTFPTP